MTTMLRMGDYSYTNAIGYALRCPLFSLVTTSALSIASLIEPKIVHEPLALRVTKTALSCLSLTLFCVPLGAAWLAGKVLANLSKPKINLKGLHIAPPQIKPPTEDAVADIHIQDLVERANRAGLSPAALENLTTLIERVTSQNPEYYTNDAQRPEFYKKLTLYLQGITQKLASGTFPKEKEKAIFQELAEASARCAPTWLEVASRLWSEITSAKPIGAVKLLKLVQEYKENLILEFSQVELGIQWHALNFARALAGKELGLNTTLSEFDPYIQSAPCFCKEIVQLVFLHKYQNANRLISAIETSINLVQYDYSYFDLLKKIMTEQGISNPGTYVGAHFYTENTQTGEIRLNSLGVTILLKYVQVLK